MVERESHPDHAADPTSGVHDRWQSPAAGAERDPFAECVRADRYAAWTAQVTDAASRAGVTGTPTVQVDGTEIERTPQALRDAVLAAQR
ncbi:MAG TPA: thioredoxin domain-containing protein [Actinophytocola sp.]|nr:thioredoxin domain-containing protein [Actinophytocola sp.]